MSSGPVRPSLSCCLGVASAYILRSLAVAFATISGTFQKEHQAACQVAQSLLLCHGACFQAACHADVLNLILVIHLNLVLGTDDLTIASQAGHV